MKRLLLIWLVLCITAVALQAATALTFSSDFVYDGNVFQLSDYDLQRFDNGEGNLQFIKTTDDMIWQTSARAENSFKLNNIGVTPSFKVAGYLYGSNTDKSNYSVLGNVALRLQKNILNLSAGYYPDNYLRQYADNDGTGGYEKFAYDKNLFKADLTLPVIDKNRLYLYAKLEQYYYNEFFTEFDGNATTYGLGWKYSGKMTAVDAAYFYRNFDNDATSETVDAGDAAYESNIYDISVSWRHIRPLIGLRYVPIVPTLSLNLEDRYYQGVESLHSGRHDSIYNVGISTTASMTKNLDIRLDFSRTLRNVSSNSLSAARYKEYTENTFLIGFGYKWSILR
jgi:hypothetical protein